MIHVFLRTKYREYCYGIPNNIIMERVKNIASFANMEIPVGNYQFMLRYQMFNNRPEVIPIKNIGLKVLIPAISSIDEGSFCKDKRRKSKKRNNY